MSTGAELWIEHLEHTTRSIDLALRPNSREKSLAITKLEEAIFWLSRAGSISTEAQALLKADAEADALREIRRQLLINPDAA